MLNAVVLICAVHGSDPCTQENALDLMRLPETYAVPTACLIGGEQFVAILSISGEYDKYRMVVHCQRSK